LVVNRDQDHIILVTSEPAFYADWIQLLMSYYTTDLDSKLTYSKLRLSDPRLKSVMTKNKTMRFKTKTKYKTLKFKTETQ